MKPQKHLLLIGDLPCYGRMAVNAMLPVCSHSGLEVSVLPTALVSNNFAYGRFDVLDTTDFMRRTFDHWQALGFKFDAVYTGFLCSKAQTDLIAARCREYRAQKISVFTDPIMGDHGKLYNGITLDDVENMRSLIKYSDFIMPNLTEACYLTGTPCKDQGFSLDEGHEILEKLKKLCPGTVLITSALCDGQNMVLGFDAEKQEILHLPYTPVAGKEFHGTGDVFASLFISRMLKNNDVKESALYAMQTVAAMIKRNMSNDDLFDGLNLGICLDLLNGD